MGFFQKLFKRRPPVPEMARRHLQKDEDSLAWAQAVTGQIVVATRRGLHLVGENEHRLVLWHEISKATWGERLLTVIESRVIEGSHIADRPAWKLMFDEPGGVPVVLRRRVEASIVHSIHEQIGGGVRIIGRKVAGRDGLLWQFRLDDERPLTNVERAELEKAVDFHRDLHTPVES